jgi:hypothetical protein
MQNLNTFDDEVSQIIFQIRRMIKCCDTKSTVTNNLKWKEYKKMECRLI